MKKKKINVESGACCAACQLPLNSVARRARQGELDLVVIADWLLTLSFVTFIPQIQPHTHTRTHTHTCALSLFVPVLCNPSFLPVLDNGALLDCFLFMVLCCFGCGGGCRSSAYCKCLRPLENNVPVLILVISIDLVGLVAPAF